MKKIFIFPVIILFLSGVKVISQEEIAENTAKELPAKVETNSMDMSSLDFIKDYEINITVGKKAKILSETQLKAKPDDSGETLLTIAAGVVVETFRYLPKEALWAIRFNDTWGFIPATSVMPIQEKTTDVSQTPFDEAPKMVSAIQLNYPPEAKQQGISGKVIVKALISKTGSVLEVETVKSISGLDEAAIEAVKKAKFKPGKFEGKPVEVWIRIPINFELSKF